MLDCHVSTAWVLNASGQLVLHHTATVHGHGPLCVQRVARVQTGVARAQGVARVVAAWRTAHGHGCWVRMTGAGCWVRVLGAGCRVLGAGCRVLGAGCTDRVVDELDDVREDQFDHGLVGGVSTRSVHGQHAVSMWPACGQHGVSACRQRTDSTLSACGQHMASIGLGGHLANVE